jgi:hypothetical protein
MDSLEHAFFHLTHLPLLDVKHAELAANATYSERPSYYKKGIQNIYADATEFSDSKFCKDIRGHFGECVATYLKMDGMSGYDWHIDVARKTCINFLIVQPPNALTIHKVNTNRLTYRTKVCDYEMFRPTVFNATIPHCVINPSNQDRYILSISVGNIAKYGDLKDWLLNYHIDSY